MCQSFVSHWPVVTCIFVLLLFHRRLCHCVDGVYRLPFSSHGRAVGHCAASGVVCSGTTEHQTERTARWEQPKHPLSKWLNDCSVLKWWTWNYRWPKKKVCGHVFIVNYNVNVYLPLWEEHVFLAACFSRNEGVEWWKSCRYPDVYYMIPKSFRVLDLWC